MPPLGYTRSSGMQRSTRLALAAAGAYPSGACSAFILYSMFCRLLAPSRRSVDRDALCVVWSDWSGSRAVCKDWELNATALTSRGARARPHASQCSVGRPPCPPCARASFVTTTPTLCGALNRGIISKNRNHPPGDSSPQDHQRRPAGLGPASSHHCLGKPICREGRALGEGIDTGPGLAAPHQQSLGDTRSLSVFASAAAAHPPARYCGGNRVCGMCFAGRSAACCAPSAAPTAQAGWLTARAGL